MRLDDIESETAPRAEEFLNRLRAIRRVATPVIEMLEQLENFQKKLWLKKKFVVETRYVMTLDRVPEELYEEIVKCDAQWEEWEELFQLSRMSDFERTSPFLITHSLLPIDTANFDNQFRSKLISNWSEEILECEGLVVNADNHQALQLLKRSLQGEVDGIYIDPPYNTEGSGFLYKDKFQHSSWLSMMENLMKTSHVYLKQSGVIFGSIDEKEQTSFRAVLSNAFGSENRVEEIIRSQNTNKNQSPTYSTTHEYIQVFARDLTTAKKLKPMFRQPKPGCIEILEAVETISQDFPELKVIEQEVKRVKAEHIEGFKEQLAKEGLEYNDETKKLDPWKGVLNYKHAEYRDNRGNLVSPEEAQTVGATPWIYRESDPSMPQVKEDSQKEVFKDEDDPAFRFYRPKHPVTKKSVKVPKRGWVWPYDRMEGQSFCFLELAADDRIAWGEDENKVPQKKSFLHETETNVANSVLNDFSDGEKDLYALFGSNRVFSNPKPVNLVKTLVSHLGRTRKTILDFFGGSGTTSHAAIDSYRADNSAVRHICIEAGDHLEEIVIPRLKKVAFSADWVEGQPISTDTGISHAFKIIRLESYEDCMNNLSLKRTDAQSRKLDQHPEVKDDYMLRYFLDVESQDSLLNTQIFHRPFDYQLDIATSSAGETVPTKVDLVETFNWLLGLKVKHMNFPKGFVTVTGTDREEKEQILIIWRNLDGYDAKDHEALTQFLERQQINPADTEYDAIYLNGPHTLDDPFNKIRLTEEHFHRLMFEGTD